MTKFGRGLNREIVAAVNSGQIAEPFSTSDIRRFIQTKRWKPAPTDQYINVTLPNATSETHSLNFKKYFLAVGDGKYMVRQQFKDIVCPRSKDIDDVPFDFVRERETFQNPCVEDQYNFLIRLYFGESQDYLGCCIQRAYLDFNRTLHGIASRPDGIALKNKATDKLREEFNSLLGLTTITNQEAFDCWHERVCHLLYSSYAESFFDEFRIGQAQKWLNMTFKYLFVFGEKRLPGFKRFYPFGHVPIDNIILEKLRQYGIPKLLCAWSRIGSYGVYMDFQQWIRQTFPSSSPLAVEFHLWQQPGESSRVRPTHLISS